MHKNAFWMHYYILGALLLSLFFMGVSPSYAKELPSLYRGIRPLGMGDAFIAVSNDENGLFYNPAGLKLGSDKRVDILNPLFEFSQGSLDSYNDASKTYTASDISDSSFDPKNDLKTASDFSFDLGGMTPLSQWLDIEEMWGNPTVGVVLQNITNLDFQENGVHPMQVNVGVAPLLGNAQTAVR